MPLPHHRDAHLRFNDITGHALEVGIAGILARMLPTPRSDPSSRGAVSGCRPRAFRRRASFNVVVRRVVAAGHHNAAARAGWCAAK